MKVPEFDIKVPDFDKKVLKLNGKHLKKIKEHIRQNVVYKEENNSKNTLNNIIYHALSQKFKQNTNPHLYTRYQRITELV